MRKGDVLFYKGTDCISKLIAWATKSPYTHVALVAGDNKIIEANRFIRTHIRDILPEEIYEVYTVEGLTDHDRERIVKVAMFMVGFRYDYGQIIRNFIRLVFDTNSTVVESFNTVICSDIVDVPYYVADVPRGTNYCVGDVTPGELLDLYPLVKYK